MQIAVIGVGTELTSGQIINKNAAWISKNLYELGVPTSCHLVVPDDRGLILDALRFSAERCDFLFVTGGLGPTTDDFTRELISEWAQAPLEFHAPSWERIQERLRSRGIEVRESQRQQALFPHGAQVLENPAGTASGFQLSVFGKEVFVLPGPPNEIAAIWEKNIGDFLRDKTKNLDRSMTYSWDTLGAGESEVAHLTEQCLMGVEVEKGYRLHMPYVEVKLTFLQSRLAELQPAIDRLDQALRSLTVSRNGADVATLLVDKLRKIKKFHLVSPQSGPQLLKRITPLLKSSLLEHSWAFSSHSDFNPDPQCLFLVLKPVDTTNACAEIHYRGATFKTFFEAPFMISKMTERKALYFAERALIFWLQKIEDLS